MLKTCPICGAEFETSNKKRQCCSPLCSSKYCRARAVEKAPLQKCLYCGKEFKPKKLGVKFCSVKCSAKNASKYAVHRQPSARKIKREMTPTAIAFITALANIEDGQEFLNSLFKSKSDTGEDGLKKCLYCGKPLKAANGQLKYCSEECYRKFRNEKRRRKRGKLETTRQETTLERYSREASMCHMDYGNYRAAREVLGKTFEELLQRAGSQA